MNVTEAVKTGALSILVVALAIQVAPRIRAAEAEVVIPADARKAIDRALEYFAKAQNPDGSWDTYGRGRATACTALAGLAFMSDGHLPGRGPYGAVVDKALSYVLSSSQVSGLLEYGTPHHAMYSHGFA
ncbi:MAG: hypothetical protein ACYTAN_02785, partial [Planctomycetota bacterium]